MFENLFKHVTALEKSHQLKLDNGHYPSCRDARYVLQQIIIDAKELRKTLTANTKVRTALTQPAREVLKAAEKEESKRLANTANQISNDMYDDE